MSTQVSAPVRIVALVGLLAALAMGAWVMTAGRGGTDSADAVVPVKPAREAGAAATNLSTRNRSTEAGKATAATPVVKPAPRQRTATPAPKLRVTKATRPAAKLPSGTPKTIAGLLARHEVVVVLLYDPQAKVDEYSLAEAAVGAKNADAGFLRVDVRNRKQTLPFVNAYGVLQDPTLLFFKRPGKLALKLSGFADNATVTQAAANAARGLATVTP